MTRVVDLPPRCFAGEMPAILATCAADGTPNATWLSQVYLVDETHVAASCQFFRKTAQNLEANPRARILVVDPVSLGQWTLDLRFVRSETAGPTFEVMKQRIEAVAELTGMTDVFALRSAEVFEVLGVEVIYLDVAADATSQHEIKAKPAPVSATSLMAGLARLAAGISVDLDRSIELGLEVLTTQLGYEGVTLYLHEESEGLLYALASRGFTHSGVGASIPLGEGLIGTAGRERRVIRVQDTTREQIYALAVMQQVERVRGGGAREIRLPGLACSIW